jgi:hypothetical protein
MSNNPPAIIEYALEIVLLEDLHSGSGTGDSVIDRLHARDLDGHPIIPWTHIKGVWKDNALRLEWLGMVTPEQIERLFGKSGAASSGQGKLICPGFAATQYEGALPTWDATARRPKGNRAPDDHSLRRSEYLPAGTRLEGIVRLAADAADLEEALRDIVRFTDRLGSERTRGGGQIRVERFEPRDTQAKGRGVKIAKDTSVLRLLLRTLAPVCIPTTGYPGNIIGSETHIPGRALSGALASAAISRGIKPDSLFDREVSVGPAYPLPRGTDVEEAKSSLGSLLILPFPLHLQNEKPEPREQALWPHWAGEAGGLGLRDCLTNPPNSDEGVQLKRPKSNAYLCNDGNDSWTYFEQALEPRMRNRRHGPFDEVVKESALDLFTVEAIPSGTLLVCDIHPLAKGGLARFASLLSLVETDPILRVGRGGAPVEILRHAAMRRQRGSSTKNRDDLTLLLTSDLIARDPETLGFRQDLTTRAIADLLGIGDVDLDHTKKSRFSDVVRLSGFNAASGLPHAPALAVRRGSIIRIQGKDVPRIRDELKRRGFLGERPWDGLGRFLLDPDIQVSGIRSAAEIVSRPSTDERMKSRERAIEKATCFCAKLDSGLVTRSQLGNLRAHLAELREASDRDKLHTKLDGFLMAAKQRRGQEGWCRLQDQGLVSELLDVACKGATCSLESAETFLRVMTLEIGKEDDHDE